MSSRSPLIHLNELKEQLLGDGLGEAGVDAKIMHQSVVDKDHVESPFDGHHLMIEGHHKNVFLCMHTPISDHNQPWKIYLSKLFPK